MFHEKIIEYCSRPFKDCDDQINKLINGHNAVVNRGDSVVFLGDLFFNHHVCTRTKRSKWGGDIDSERDRRPAILDAMNGQKFFIRGNHDYTEKWPESVSGRFVWIRDIHPAFRVRSSNQTFFLCHYPVITWPGFSSGTGVIMIHGHVHSPDPLDYRRRTAPCELVGDDERVELCTRSLDVGVDGHNYIPWSTEQIIKACER